MTTIFGFIQYPKPKLNKVYHGLLSQINSAHALAHKKYHFKKEVSF